MGQIITSKANNNVINTEFEKFYQSILTNISHIPDDQLAVLKTRIRNTCHKYNQINVPYRYRQIIRNLSNKIKVLKQDKDRGVVIMDSSQYMKKCLDMLNNDNFIKLTDNPTKSIEGKIQRAIRKIKSKLSKDEYNKIYSTGSASGKLYGTANVHMMAENDNIDNLPLRPIISNIGTAPYHLVKHLAKVLSPLSHSEFPVKNAKAFLQVFKNMLLPDDYKLISFDVTSLFTSVPLDYTISIILKRIYDQRELGTKILRKKNTRSFATMQQKRTFFL